MLLGNLDPPNLCYGTMLIVKAWTRSFHRKNSNQTNIHVILVQSNLSVVNVVWLRNAY